MVPWRTNFSVARCLHAENSQIYHCYAAACCPTRHFPSHYGACLVAQPPRASLVAPVRDPASGGSVPVGASNGLLPASTRPYVASSQLLLLPVGAPKSSQRTRSFVDGDHRASLSGNFPATDSGCHLSYPFTSSI